jgi:SAM-dependent methyltransferase
MSGDPRLITLSSWLSAEAQPERRQEPRGAGVLVISEETIRSVARRRAPLPDLVRAVVRQVARETVVRRIKKIQFRSRRNAEACRAYCAMNALEFEGINAPQRWSNWRIIPRSLNGRAPDRPVKALDLCCGTGQSTQVLAHYLAPGSEILGLEYNPRFVEVARGRAYRTRTGLQARVAFVAQSVLTTFRDPAGTALPERSVDVVNSCGAVGCHFDEDATATLAAEVDRVLRLGGLAMIDSGPGGSSPAQVEAIFTARGFAVLYRARSCRLDPYRHICFRKPGAAW